MYVSTCVGNSRVEGEIVGRRREFPGCVIVRDIRGVAFEEWGALVCLMQSLGLWECRMKACWGLF